jgi:hypothetical protein
VLLVREMQAQSLMAIAMNFGGHPVYGPMLKNRDLLRKIFQAHMIPADEVMLSDEQIDAVLAIAAKQAEQDAKAGAKADNSMQLAQIKRDMQMDRIKADIEIANMEGDYRLKAAKYARDTAMMTLAAQQNMDSKSSRRCSRRATRTTRSLGDQADGSRHQGARRGGRSRGDAEAAGRRAARRRIFLEDQIKAMVSRFLAWKLPGSFAPDGGHHLPSADAHREQPHPRLRADRHQRLRRHAGRGDDPAHMMDGVSWMIEKPDGAQ